MRLEPRLHAAAALSVQEHIETVQLQGMLGGATAGPGWLHTVYGYAAARDTAGSSPPLGWMERMGCALLPVQPRLPLGVRLAETKAPRLGIVATSLERSVKRYARAVLSKRGSKEDSQGSG